MNDDLGYEIIESVLADRECDELLAVLTSETLARSRAGARHLLSIDAVNALANDARLTTLATRVPFRATLFDK